MQSIEQIIFIEAMNGAMDKDNAYNKPYMRQGGFFFDDMKDKINVSPKFILVYNF